MFMCQFLC